MIKLLEVHIPARKRAKIDSGIRKLFKLIRSDTKTAEIRVRNPHVGKYMKRSRVTLGSQR